MKASPATKLRSKQRPYARQSLQDGSFADVAGTPNLSLGIPQNVESTAPAHGSPLRRELGAERLHITRRSAGVGAGNHGRHAGHVHAGDVDHPRIEASRRV